MAFPIAALIGGAATLAGGVLGANAAKSQANSTLQAERENRDAEELRAFQIERARLRALHGPQLGDQILQSRMTGPQREKYFGRAARSQSFTPQEQARVAAIDQEIAAATRGNSGGAFGWGNQNRQSQNSQTSSRVAALQAEKAALLARAGGDAGSTGLFSNDNYPNMPTIGQRYDGLIKQSDQDTNSLLNYFNEDTASLSRGYGDLRSMLDGYGKQEEARIRRDANTSKGKANQAAFSRYAASGLSGSSLPGETFANNERLYEQGAQDQIGQLNDRRIGMGLTLGQNQLSTLAQRLGTKATIRGTGVDRTSALRKGFADLQSNIELNPTMPNVVPASGASPSAAFGGNIGASLTAIGAPTLGYGLQGLFGRNSGSGNQPDFENMTNEQLREYARSQGGI